MHISYHQLILKWSSYGRLLGEAKILFPTFTLKTNTWGIMLNAIKNLSVSSLLSIVF